MKSAHDGSPQHLSLASVALSDEFKKAAAANGYYTLGDILDILLTELIQKDWFTPGMFEELSQAIKGFQRESKI
jgi:hypothetical protein